MYVMGRPVTGFSQPQGTRTHGDSLPNILILIISGLTAKFYSTGMGSKFTLDLNCAELHVHVAILLHVRTCDTHMHAQDQSQLQVPTFLWLY